MLAFHLEDKDALRRGQRKLVGRLVGRKLPAAHLGACGREDCHGERLRGSFVKREREDALPYTDLDATKRSGGDFPYPVEVEQMKQSFIDVYLAVAIAVVGDGKSGDGAVARVFQSLSDFTNSAFCSASSLRSSRYLIWPFFASAG